MGKFNIGANGYINDPDKPRPMSVATLIDELSKYPHGTKIWCGENLTGKPIYWIVSCGVARVKLPYSMDRDGDQFELGMEPSQATHARWCHWTVGSVTLAGRDYRDKPVVIKQIDHDDIGKCIKQIWTKIIVKSRVDSVMLLVEP